MSALDPEDNSKPSHESKKFPQYLAAFFATLASVSAGTYLSWTSAAIQIYKNPGELPLDDNDESWVGSLLPLGALVGALPAGWISDKLGRKMSIMVAVVPLLVSWFGIGFAPSVAWLMASRAFAGAGIGAVSVTVPTYVSEIAEPAIRGTLGSVFQLQITIGVMLGYMIGLIGNLKYIAMSSTIIPAALLISFPFMPESPVWLMSKNRRDEAEKALQRLRGENYPIHEELGQIDGNKKPQKKEKVGITELKHHKKAVLISMGLMVLQQLSGINAVIFYAGEIFKEKSSTISADLCAAIFGTFQVFATYISTILVDRAGRRVLLMTSSSVMGLCLVALALHLHFNKFIDPETVTPGIPWVPLISLIIYVSMFATGFGPIPWIMVGEVSPTNVVGTISSAGAMLNWGLAFTVTKTFPNMNKALGGPLSFGMFAIICATGTIFIATVIPETKGKTTEEIQIRLHRIKKKPTQNETVSNE